MQKVYGVEDPASFVRFETRVKLSHTSFIDVMIPATHTMIEQKGRGVDLEKPIRQSDGTLLKPAEQAKRYAAALPYSERPRWIITCNFRQFRQLERAVQILTKMVNDPIDPLDVVAVNLHQRFAKQDSRSHSRHSPAARAWPGLCA